MSEISYETIERCPHDKENPYTMVNTALIRDENLSPECRWLLIYLLSMKSGWLINVIQIYNHVKSFIGRDRVYRLIEEAIEAGYISKKIIYSGNLRKGVKYYLSESAKFKKSFRYPESQEPGAQYPENQEALSSTISSSEEEDKKEYNKVKSAPPPPSADASDLCKFFIEKIKERNPKFKDPRLREWEKEFQYLLEIDKRDVQETKELIEWIHVNSFWKANCLSPEALRKHYDKMWMQRQAEGEQAIIEANRGFAINLKKKYPEILKNLTISPKYAMKLDSGKELPFTLPADTFKNALCNMFGGRYEPDRESRATSDVENTD